MKLYDVVVLEEQNGRKFILEEGIKKRFAKKIVEEMRKNGRKVVMEVSKTKPQSEE